MSATKPPLSDYSTQAARTAENRRRRLRRTLLAQWSAAHAVASAAKLAALRRISAEQWSAAKAEGADNETVV